MKGIVAATELLTLCMTIIILVYQTTRKDKSRSSIIFLHLCVSVSVMLLLDSIAWIIDGTPGKFGFILVNVLSFLVYFCSFFVPLLWCSYVLYSSKISLKTVKILRTFFYIPFGIGILLTVLTPKFGFLYIIKDGANISRRGPLFQIIPILYSFYIIGGLCFSIGKTVTETNKEDKKLFVALSLIPLIPIAGSIFQVLTGFIAGWISYAFSLLIFFLVLETQKETKLQIQFEQLKYVELQESISVMKAQLQPHFLYNALSTINALCIVNPPQAQATVSNFSYFLRSNINSLSERNVVPFTQEIDQVKNYMSIQMVRFPNISITYELPVTSFSLPMLTIQPVVAHAVDCNLSTKSNDGKILIRTLEEQDSYVITISDNGSGLDESAATDEESFEFITDRIHMLCAGTLTITNMQNKGTIVTITVPK
jgi:sensor histidine kinase YesM